MTARQRIAFAPTPTERKALEQAACAFVQWRRDWHDDGAACSLDQLATVRKAARAFHKAVQPVLAGGGVNGTRARLLMRMQEVYRAGQADYLDRLESAYATALQVDAALAKDVAQGRKKNQLVYVWVFHAADLWPGEPPAAAGRFGAALLEFHHKCVPEVGSVERIADALKMWRRAGK